MSSSSNHNDNNDSPCYKDSQHSTLQILYIFAIIIWLLLTAVYGLILPKDHIEMFILCLPILSFVITFCSVHLITSSVESNMLKANLLTLGLLVALPLLNWSKEATYENKVLFMKLAATAIIFSMITLIDWWTPCKWTFLVKHIKSILQTFAIVLLIFGLYRFFCESTVLPTGFTNNAAGAMATDF